MSYGAALQSGSNAIRYRHQRSFTPTPPRAKLSREEPDAGNLHVRVREGWGWQHPHLLGRLGFAVQLALLRHPGVGLAQMDQPVDALVIWLAAQLEIPAVAFVEYAARSQTMNDHARELASTLGLRLPTAGGFMIEAAAQSAWSTDRGRPIATGVIEALRTEKI